MDWEFRYYINKLAVAIDESSCRGFDSSANVTATEVFLAGSAQNAGSLACEQRADLEYIRVDHVWKKSGYTWMAVNAWSNVNECQ